VTFILEWNADAPLWIHKANYRKECTLVMCTFCAFLNYRYIPRFEILAVVLLRLLRRTVVLVVPGGWKERAAFIFKGDVWTETTWTLSLILLSVNTNHANLRFPQRSWWRLNSSRMFRRVDWKNCFTICQLTRRKPRECKSL